MKHKYKIRVDQPVPSGDQIDRHRNFDGLLADYQNLTKPLYRRPLYKNPKTFIGLLFIIVLAVLVFQAVEEEDKEKDLTTKVMGAREKAFLNPPVVALAATSEIKTVTPGLDAEFSLREGPVLHIPSGAFAGREHQIQVEVVAYPSPLSAVLNGIPLIDDRGVGLNPLHLYSIVARCQGKEIEWDANSPLWIQSESSVDTDSETAVAYTMDLEKMHWRPEKGSTSLEKRVVKGHLSTHLDDGFGVVEVDEDGKAHSEKLTASSVEEQTSGTTFVRRTEIKSPGLHLCGVEVMEEGAEQNVRLVDSSGKTHPLEALYQVAEGTIKTAWSGENGEFRVTSEPCLLFGFLANGTPARLDWEGDGRTQPAVLLLVPELALGPITDQTALEAFLFKGE